MFARLMLLVVLSAAAFAAKPAPKPAPQPAPITLPDKYSPIFYEHLEGKEKARCEKYVDELKLMAKRKQLGVRPGDAGKMEAKQQQIEANYDKYCLRLQK